MPLAIDRPAKKFIDQVIFDAKVSDRKILIVPVNTIRHTAYNPLSRTKEGAKLKRLIESVTKSGIIYPILITEDRNVVDGNRRLAAARAAGLENIDCIICGLEPDEAFRTVNTTAEKIAGKGWLEIARTGGIGSLPKKELGEYNELFDLIGTYGVDLLIQQNLGLGVLSLCKSVCSYGTTKRLEEVIIKTALNKLTNKLNAIIRSDKTRVEKVAEMDLILST
ncbi:MAG: ParB N-terminal domain-containing protein [Polynucleobacter sp.]|jgi:hypothetical protein